MKTKIKILLVAALLTFIFSIPAMAAIGTPTNLKQTGANKNSISISWTEVVGTDLHYETYISVDGVNWTQEGAYVTGNTEEFYNLTSGTTYYVKVRAWNWDTEEYGAYSDVLTVSTTPTEPTTIVQSAATENSITLKWDACNGATSYNIYKYENEIQTLIGTSNTTSYTISGLDNTKEISFYIQVKSVRDIGIYKSESRNYAYISKSKMTLVPGKVGEIDFSCYRSLEEAYVACDVEHAVGYDYECYDNAGKLVDSGTFSYSANVKNIRLNQFYKIRLRAFANMNDTKVYGQWSNYKYFAQSVIITKAKKAGTKLKLKWKKVKGATNYVVYASTSRNENTFKKVGTTKKAQFDVTKIKKKKIKKNKTYYVKVVAVKKVGNVQYISDNVYYTSVW